MEDILLDDSLFGDIIPKKLSVKEIKAKTSKPKVVKPKTLDQKLKSKTTSLSEKVELIKAEVYKILGHFKDDTICIYDYNELVKYFDKAIENGLIVIDTETNNSLNNIDCKLMGLCLYTPGMKQAYVPVNHVKIDYDTFELPKVASELEAPLLEGQLTEEQISAQLKRLENTKIIYHNSYFDIVTLYTTCGVRLGLYWDTWAGARLLDENEQANLKIQYRTHIDPDQEKYDIEHLFKGLPYAIFDPSLFALYAATDCYETYKLYEYQVKEFDKPENQELFINVLQNIEHPVIKPLVNMKLVGVCIDKVYATKMSVAYTRRLEEIDKEIEDEMQNIKPLIDAWRLTPEANSIPQANDCNGRYKYSSASGGPGDAPYWYDTLTNKQLSPDEAKKLKLSSKRGKSKCEQLPNDISFSSPTQLSILLYDVLKVPQVSWEHPRGTGADILEELSEEHHVNLCTLILKRREVEILLNNFINKIPEFVQEKTGRLHCSFNSMGAATGRFSSSDPSLQQIPAHAKDVRMMFVAPKGYSLIGADFSAQEPRSTASLALDEKMLSAYEEGKDLYAVIGATCFNCNYEDCLEFSPTGELQPEGKERRSAAKAILLGICYGMGAKSLAARINKTEKEAQDIINNFYNGFAGVKKLTDDSQEMLKKYGYVTDMWGRRRHIPDAQLKPFEVKSKVETKFNPLIGAVNHQDLELEKKIKEYEELLANAKYKKEIDNLTKKAQADGLTVRNNKGFINRALRQCLNARIQGTAASMTKRAMILIDEDEELNRLGFKLCVTVHDEVWGVAPTENSEAVAKRLSEVMVSAAKEKCVCKFKCDAYIVKRWYADEFSGNVKNTFVKLTKGGTSEQDAIKQLQDKYTAVNPEYIKQMCYDEFDPNLHEDI